MAGESSNSALVDPLGDLHGPALFPRTVIASGGLQMPEDSKSLDSIHVFMKSLKELSSPENLLNEAKRIVNEGAELLGSNLSSFTEKIAVENSVVPKFMDRPDERRPGLGLARRRASFSLKATVSKTSVGEPNLDIDKLQDPDEFFDAYERLENAKKEIQKQMGGNSDTVSQQRTSLARRHRPGILGKSYSYKHRYSSNPSHDDILLTFQEAEQVNLKNHIDDPPGKEISPYSVLSDGADFEPAGDKTGNKYSSILDNLLSCNNEDLDEDGALNLLQERLNIKPLDLEILNNTEVHVVGSTISNVEKTLLAHSIDLASTHKALAAGKSESPVRNEIETQSDSHAASPTSRSPLSSLASLMKRIGKINPPKSLLSSARDLFSSKGALDNETDESHDRVHASEDLRLTHLDTHVNVETSEPVILDVEAVKLTETSDSHSEQPTDRNVGLQNGYFSNEPNKGSDINTEAAMNDDNAHGTGRNQPDDSLLDDDAMRGTSRLGLEQQVPIHQEKPPAVKNKLSGEKRIRKAHPMRKSIGEGGTSFENGVRRSKRIKVRPLEYWKGERLLYGRVQDSLKLIGVRCFSPGNGDAKMKVKPYIPSESSEIKSLLDWAARH